MKPSGPRFEERGEVIVVCLFHERRHVVVEAGFGRHRALAQRPSRFIEADAFRKERRSLSLAGVAPPHPVSNEAVPALVGCLLDSLQADLRGEKECRQQDKRECRYGAATPPRRR